MSIRESLSKRGIESWEAAESWKEKWKARSSAGQAETKQAVQIDAATEKFKADAEARRLHPSTIYKYTLLFRQLRGFALRRGLRFLNELDVDTLSEFRFDWKDGPRASLKKLERLRSFLTFCERRKWIPDNPARALKPPKVSLCPTLPFTSGQMIKIHAATDKYLAEIPANGKNNARRLPGLILVMRYAGLRISDAVGLTNDRIQGNKLFLYTQKTGVPVFTILPEEVIKALNKTPRVTPQKFFWSGQGKLETCVRVWETRLRKLFKLAEIPKGHAHQFRDTFAVELLLAGVPMERVSILLGHSSIRITERHYAPWVKSRQEQLEADVTRAHSCDPLLAAIGTPEVQDKQERVN